MKMVFNWLIRATGLVFLVGCTGNPTELAAQNPSPAAADRAATVAHSPAPKPAPAKVDRPATNATPDSCQVGDSAPDFTLANETGQPVTLSKISDKRGVLLAFYPKDFTGG